MRKGDAATFAVTARRSGGDGLKAQLSEGGREGGACLTSRPVDPGVRRHHARCLTRGAARNGAHDAVDTPKGVKCSRVVSTR